MAHQKVIRLPVWVLYDVCYIHTMKVNRKESKLLFDAIEEWQREDLLDEAKADELKKSVSSYRSEFDSLAFYASIAAVSCALLAFGALVLDEKWVERLRNFFEFSEIVIGCLFGLISAFLVWVAKRRKTKHPYASLANESFTILIALTIGVSMAYFARSFNSTIQSYGFVIFITAILYGALAIYLRSKILWVCMLLGLMSGWATQTWYWSADPAHSYFLGMNYPLRMTLFGAFLLMISYVTRNHSSVKDNYALSWYCSWLFFLISGLFLSVSGNLSYDVWAAIKQGKLFMWAIAYTLLLIAVLAYAIKYKDETLRDITIVFFLLNIYTRYFEYFWDHTSKGLFFAILALSFWLIGKKAEQLRKKLSE